MITILATICALATGECSEVTVTTSDFAHISMQACMMGAPQIAEWMHERPTYRLAGWRCQIGERRRGA